MPKNTALPMLIAGFSLLAGFALIWHIWWLAVVGLLGIITCLIIRSLDEETEYVISASEVEAIEEKRPAGRRYA